MGPPNLLELNVDGQMWVSVEDFGPNLATFGKRRKNHLHYPRTGSFQMYHSKEGLWKDDYNQKNKVQSFGYN